MTNEQKAALEEMTMTNEQKAALVASLTNEEVALVKELAAEEEFRSGRIAATTDEEHVLWMIQQRRRLAQFFGSAKCEGPHHGAEGEGR